MMVTRGQKKSTVVTRGQKTKKSLTTATSTATAPTNDFLLEKITELENTVNLVSTKLESIVSNIADKDKIITKLKKKNQDLELKLENLEIDLTNLNQYGRRECVEITNIPESVSQHKLEEYVIKLLKDIKVEVHKRDLVAVHRIGFYKRGSNRVVIVKFINRKDANRTLKSKAKLQKNPALRKIRIRENLCPARKQIFNKLYKLLMGGKIKDLWSQNGNIFIIRNNEDESILIEHVSDIDYYLNGERIQEEIYATGDDEDDEDDDDDVDESDDDDDDDELEAKVVNLRDLTENLREWAQKPGNLYIGRKNDHLLRDISDFWGNPFIPPNKSKKELLKSLQSYKGYIKKSENHMKRLPEIKNHVLGCWCKNKVLCHAKILIDLQKEDEVKTSKLISPATDHNVESEQPNTLLSDPQVVTPIIPEVVTPTDVAPVSSSSPILVEVNESIKSSEHVNSILTETPKIKNPEKTKKRYTIDCTDDEEVISKNIIKVQEENNVPSPRSFVTSLINYVSGSPNDSITHDV